MHGMAPDLPQSTHSRAGAAPSSHDTHAVFRPPQDRSGAHTEPAIEESSRARKDVTARSVQVAPVRYTDSADSALDPTSTGRREYLVITLVATTCHWSGSVARVLFITYFAFSFLLHVFALYGFPTLMLVTLQLFSWQASETCFGVAIFCSFLSSILQWLKKASLSTTHEVRQHALSARISAKTAHLKSLRDRLSARHRSGLSLSGLPNLNAPAGIGAVSSPSGLVGPSATSVPSAAGSTSAGGGGSSDTWSVIPLIYSWIVSVTNRILHRSAADKPGGTPAVSSDSKRLSHLSNSSTTSTSDTTSSLAPTASLTPSLSYAPVGWRLLVVTVAAVMLAPVFYAIVSLQARRWERTMGAVWPVARDCAWGLALFLRYSVFGPEAHLHWTWLGSDRDWLTRPYPTPLFNPSQA